MAAMTNERPNEAVWAIPVMDEAFSKHEMINNEIVVAAFRKFCRENNLNFHFWDELRSLIVGHLA